MTSLKEFEDLQATIGDQVTLLTGATVIFKCPATGLPSPRITWRKDAEEISTHANTTYVTREGTLQINNVTTKDSGVYTCEAVNRAGRFSYSSEFKIIGNPRFYYRVTNAFHFL